MRQISDVDTSERGVTVETWTDTPGDWLALLSIIVILMGALGWYIRTESGKTRKEFKTNGGSSAKDQWTRIEGDLVELKSLFIQHLVNHSRDQRQGQREYDGPERRRYPHAYESGE